MWNRNVSCLRFSFPMSDGAGGWNPSYAPCRRREAGEIEPVEDDPTEDDMEACRLEMERNLRDSMTALEGESLRRDLADDALVQAVGGVGVAAGGTARVQDEEGLQGFPAAHVFQP